MIASEAQVGFDLTQPGSREGVHVSDYLGALYQYPARDVDPHAAWLECGLMWEQYLEAKLAPAGWSRPPEATYEGTLYNCDLIHTGPPKVVGEIKWTSKSCKDAIVNGKLHPKFEKFERQLMTYCLFEGTLQGALFVLFVNGDYSKPFTPRIKCYALTYTEQELQQNWATLKEAYGQ